MGGMACWGGCIAPTKSAESVYRKLVFQVLQETTELYLLGYWWSKGEPRPPDEGVHSDERVGLDVENWLHLQTALAVIENIRVDGVRQSRKEKDPASSIKLECTGDHLA